MSKGHYTGTTAASNMRHGAGSGASAGMVRMAAPNKMAAKVGGGRAAGNNMTVGSRSAPKGMKIQRAGE